MQAGALLADRAFDTDNRVIEPLLVAGKTPVTLCMPSCSQVHSTLLRARPRPDSGFLGRTSLLSRLSRGGFFPSPRSDRPAGRCEIAFPDE
jgi:hypothetical protein